MSFLRILWLILRKDLTVEIRSGEIALTALLFAVSCVLVFAFAFVRQGVPPDGAAAAVALLEPPSACGAVCRYPRARPHVRS